MRTKWPEEMPVLSGRDLHRGSLDGPRGTHCLIGWQINAFDSPSILNVTKEEKRFLDAVEYAAIQLGAEFGDPHSDDIAGFNDNPKNSKALLARIFNRASAICGYVVNNPEAKYLKKR